MTTIAATAATGGGVAPTGLSGCRSEGVGPVAEPVTEPVAPPLRRLIGEVLRRVRQAQGRTLRDVAAAARVSMPYLSEVERGRKEASSEVLAAICRALNIRLVDLLAEVMTELARYEPLPLKGAAPAAPAAPTAPMAPSEARGALVATEPEVVAATPITAHPVALSSAAAHRMGTGPSAALGGLGALGAAYAGLNVHVVVARPGRAARRVAGRHRRAFPLRPAARPGPARVIRPSGRPSSRVRRHPRGAGPEDGPAGMACGTVAAEPSRHRR